MYVPPDPWTRVVHVCTLETRTLGGTHREVNRPGLNVGNICLTVVFTLKVLSKITQYVGLPHRPWDLNIGRPVFTSPDPRGFPTDRRLHSRQNNPWHRNLHDPDTIETH